MVNLNRSRRGRYHRCLYWKRDDSVSNEELAHRKTPSGVFYARISSSKGNDTADTANAFHSGYETLTIETEDTIDLKKDDLVQFDESLWLAGRVNSDPIQKNSCYKRRASSRTTIELRKGR